jgi:ATP-binding cassette subfamily B protein
MLWFSNPRYAIAPEASMTTKDRKPSITRRTLHYYWRVTAVQWPVFLLAVLSTLGFIACLSYGNPYVVALIVDRVGAEPVAADQVFTVFAPYIIALIVLNLVGQVCSKLQDYSVWKLEIRASYELATHAFDTLSNQSMMFHSNRFGGSLVSQTQKFLNAYAALTETFIYAIIPILSSAAFTIGLLAPLVPLYVLILVVLLIIYVIVVYTMFKRVLPLNEDAAAAQNKLSGELSDSITNILSVKTSGRESYERGIFDEANREVVEADSRRMRASVFRGAVAASIIVIVMVFLAIFVTGGNAWFGISAGTLVVMFTYTYSLMMQFNRINQTFQSINRALGDAHDMTVILDEPRLVADDPDAAELVVTQGAIDFGHLNFWYADADERDKVFSDFNLHIPAGQRVGLVGRSGSGKTTLTTLLLRLADIQEGHVLIDGQDISHVTQVSLRRQIAFVPQEPLLFHRTVRENIAYGKPDATDAEIRRAAEKANAIEFIEKLPHGFETLTGERGVKLSGGQRQRIAIARAILTDAPILVLDEATSALDSESEKLIQDALANLMEGRTSIVIAHRLSTVASLDRIVVLSDGEVVEDGTHAELIERGGEYAQLWSRQTGAFLENE